MPVPSCTSFALTALFSLLSTTQYADASLLELFTDLFFAANYTVFTQTQAVTSSVKLAAYVGYFTTLWMTWLLVAMYDVRYVTDCVFERVARGIHLGVMVGFAVVAPSFDPSDQDKNTMRTMCRCSIRRWSRLVF